MGAGRKEPDPMVYRKESGSNAVSVCFRGLTEFLEAIAHQQPGLP